MKCLRCRNDAAADSSFCERCLKRVSVPLAESPYLNTQINLKAKRESAPAQTTAATTAAKSEKAKRSCKGLIAAVIILSLLCLVFAAGCAWFSRALWLPYLR